MEWGGDDAPVTADPKVDPTGIVVASCKVEVGQAVCIIADPEDGFVDDSTCTPQTPIDLGLRTLRRSCGGDTVVMHGAGLA